MEEKKGRMLDMDAEEVGDIQTEICNGLKVVIMTVKLKIDMMNDGDDDNG